MLTNSWPTSMSAHPPGGHGLLCSMSQMPERSGLPSEVRGVGAVRSGRPLLAFGTPAVGYFSHCAETVPVSADSMMAMPVTIFMGTSGCAQDATPAQLAAIRLFGASSSPESTAATRWVLVRDNRRTG